MTSHPRRVQSSTAREKNGVLWTISPFPNISGDISPSAFCCCCSDSEGKTFLYVLLSSPIFRHSGTTVLKAKQRTTWQQPFDVSTKYQHPELKCFFTKTSDSKAFPESYHLRGWPPSRGGFSTSLKVTWGTWWVPAKESYRMRSCLKTQPNQPTKV